MYAVDPLTGAARHKFSKLYPSFDNGYQDVIRFSDRPKKPLTCIRLTSSTPLGKYSMLDVSIMKKLMPGFKSSTGSVAILWSDMKKMAPTRSISHNNVQDCLAERALNILAYEKIADRLLTAGITSLIVLNNDLFLLSPDDKDLAQQVIHQVLKENNLEKLLYQRSNWM
jgi:hypothetical protein